VRDYKQTIARGNADLSPRVTPGRVPNQESTDGKSIPKYTRACGDQILYIAAFRPHKEKLLDLDRAKPYATGTADWDVSGRRSW
jgi:hypothetical protein